MEVSAPAGCCWILAICLAGQTAEGASQLFRDGEGGYAGTFDAAITSRELEGTGGNGLTVREQVLPCTRPPGGADESRVLLRFSELKLPAGAIVRSATLRITVGASVGLNLVGHYLLQSWDAESEKLGWLFRDGENQWNEPGGSGEGKDRVADNVFTGGGFNSPGEHTVAMSLDTTIVQAWVSEPGRNHGVMLRNAVDEEPLLIYSKRHPEEAKRPALEIEWSVPPAVRIVQPAAGATISGRITLEADPAGGAAVAGIQFYLDGQPFAPEVTGAPYRVELDTARLSNGKHTVAVRTRDAEGNARDSAAVEFTASNPALGPTIYPAPPSGGEIRVRLHPTEDLPARVERLVTFGVPFPRGALAATDLRRVRVLRAGQEVPADVGLLTPWRHVSNPAIDGKYVRVARIQISLVPGVAAPGSEEIVVEWGKQDRTLSGPVFQNPRSGWHRVTSGTFQAGDGVEEPDVYATLPAAYLASAGLQPIPFSPIEPGITEARSDPQQALNANHTGRRAYQEAEKNFFYTIINEDDQRVKPANYCDYRQQYEPWLYDRAGAMYNLYLQSGFLKPLREAVRNSSFYASQLYPAGTAPAEAVGLFRLKIPTPASWRTVNASIYSVSGGLADSYWLTGDDRFAEAIRWVAQAHLTHRGSVRWAPSLGSWTERDAGLALSAVTIAYEVFGEAVHRDRMLETLGDLRWHQEGAGGALPASRIEGGLYHYGDQHDPEEARAGELVASPWMSVILAAAVTRTFAVTEDLATAAFVQRLGTFLSAAAKRDARHGYSASPGEYTYTDYLTYADGRSHTRSGADGFEHAIDVAAGAAWSYYFSRYLGTPDAGLRALADALRATHEASLRSWTRPASPAQGLPAFRVSPWRKYGWQYGLSPSLFWAVE